jgi:hypothetical protein
MKQISIEHQSNWDSQVSPTYKNLQEADKGKHKKVYDFDKGKENQG